MLFSNIIIKSLFRVCQEVVMEKGLFHHNPNTNDAKMVRWRGCGAITHRCFTAQKKVCIKFTFPGLKMQYIIYIICRKNNCKKPKKVVDKGIHGC